MKTWARATRDHFCGGCGAAIAKDDPLLLITIRDVDQQRVRCVACVGPVPEGVTLAEPLAYGPLPFARFRPDLLPFDWKQLQAGREPGEDG